MAMTSEILEGRGKNGVGTEGKEVENLAIYKSTSKYARTKTI